MQQSHYQQTQQSGDLQLQDPSFEGMCLTTLGFQGSLRLLQLPICLSPHLHWWWMCLHNTVAYGEVCYYALLVNVPA